MLEITPLIHLDENELDYVFIRSTGPGGQNVNKVSTAVQLRFNVVNSASLPEAIKLRLLKLAGRRITSEGIMIIEARQYRTQEQNRIAARERLVRFIRQAAVPPKLRHKTKPTYTSTLRRLESKRRRGEIKRMRREGKFVE